MKTKAEQVRALRESGRVLRCHTVPHFGDYSIAEHCGQMAMMLTVLHPNPSSQLYKAIATHDFPERFTGDFPAPVKWACPELAKVLDELEDSIWETHQLTEPILTLEELSWLKALDTLELYLWCQDNYAMGNKNMTQVLRNLGKYITGSDGVITIWPTECVEYWQDEVCGPTNWKREGDNPWTTST